MKILCTGGAGYIGSVLCERLLQEEDYHVTVFDNLMYGNEHNLLHLSSNSNFEFIYGDVRDYLAIDEILPKFDIIIPLAAIVGASACHKNPVLSEEVNKIAITTLSWEASKNQLIVYPTTNSGYGTKSGKTYCTEETPLEPISLYGKQKCRTEEFLLENHSNSISLRLATVFGISPRMRMDLLVNDFVYKAMTDGYITLFEKDFKRNYVYIRDVADCFVHCIKNSDKMIGKPYNLGLSSANLSKWELANKIKEYFPNFYIHVSEIGKDPDQRNYIVSNQRLSEAGFEAKTSLDDGIKELIKGYSMLGRGKYKNA